MSAPVIIDYLMDAILRQSANQDNKQAVEQNGSEIRERMDEKLEASGSRRDFEVSSDNVTDENLTMENLSDSKTSRKRKKRTKRVEEKDAVVDGSQSIVPLIMEEGSTNLAEGNATEKRNKKRKRKKAKVSCEVQILGQNNMETGSMAKEILTIEKSRFKDDVRSMGLARMDERSRENLSEGNVNTEKPKSKDEGRTAGQTRLGAGSTVNLSEGNATVKNTKIQEEVQSVDGCRMEMGSTEKNSDNATGKRKKKHNRKAKIKDEVQGEIDTRSGEMNVRSKENLVEGDVTFEKPKVKDDVKTIGQFKKEPGSAENSVKRDVNIEKPRIKDDQITMVRGSTAEGSVTIRVAKSQAEVQSIDQTNMDTKPSENVADGQGTEKKKKKRKNKSKIKDEVQTEMDIRSTEALAEENATAEKPKIRDEILGVGSTKMDTGSFDNLTEGNLTIKDKKVESMDQAKIDTGGPTENSAEGKVTGKRKKKQRSKVQIDDEVQSNIDTRSTENPAQGNATMEKPKIKDETQSVCQSKMGTGSASNQAIKDLDEVQSMAQTKMDTGLTENSAEGNVTGKRKKKCNSKAKDNNEAHCNIDTRSTEDLAQGNEIIEMPKTKDNVQRLGQSKTNSGSTEDSALAGNATTKNLNIQDVVQDINNSKKDTGPIESSEGAVTGERKKKQKSKVKFDDDVQRQRNTSLTENLALGNPTNEMLQIKDEVNSIDQTKKDPQSIEILAERNLSIKNPEIQDEAQRMGPIKMDRRPSENLAEGNMTTEKPKIEDEVQSGVEITLCTGSSVTPAEGNVTIKNSNIQDEAHSMHQTKMDMGLREESAEGNVTAKRKKQRKKKAKTEDEIPSKIDTRSTEILAERNASIKKPEMEAEVQIGGLIKVDTGSTDIFARGNASIEKPEINYEAQSVGLTKMDTGLKENLAEEHVTVENPKITEVRNVDNTKVGDGPIGGDFTEGSVSGGRKRRKKRKSRRKKEKSEVELLSASQGGSTSLNSELYTDVCPQTAPITSIRRKLLVLDVNGLLADIIYQAANQSSGGIRMLGRTVYKRPFCDDFLKFCFQNFDVGIWSSRSKKIINKVVSYLLGNQRDKLLFCWDMSHSTQTGFKTRENKHKPLVCKELRKIWENAYPNLLWKKGDYDESNTLLLDDSPYKALLNPLHTAIFPDPYQYDNKNDDSLGPGGALRVYLEGLLKSENVQKYVEQNPIGQRPITEESSSWKFYSKVLQKITKVLQKETSMSNPLMDETPMSNPPSRDITPTPVHALS